MNVDNNRETVEMSFILNLTSITYHTPSINNIIKKPYDIVTHNKRKMLFKTCDLSQF